MFGPRFTKLLLSLGCLVSTSSMFAGEIIGRAIDSKTKQPIAGRVYVTDASGKAYFATAASGGKVVTYDVVRGESREQHSNFSAEGFILTLPAGNYNITIERGKEYHAHSTTLQVGEGSTAHTFELRRWINMAKRGWYSGETHVHRTMEDLPTLVQSEDLNVTFPLNYWVTKAFQPPHQGDRNSEEASKGKLVKVDKTHVIYPRNTEYEIFTVNGEQHMLGAVFLLNQKKVLKVGAPPLKGIAEQVHAEGGLIELDKHNWPWSMAIIPTMRVDLYELTNNHIWRTKFKFRDWGEPAPDYMGLGVSDDGFTELQWIEYGFHNYYTLLNCGLKLRPTAGTASGVHPVPLGYGRVYVNLEEGFSYDRWLEGLDKGNSFVTTGPMLFTTVDGLNSGECGVLEKGRNVKVHGRVEADGPVTRIELIQNGDIVSSFSPSNQKSVGELSVVDFAMQASVTGTSWLAVRAYQEIDGRTRFAHSAPFHFTVPDRPLKPRRVERDYLIKRVESQIMRSSGVLPEEAIAEYREALQYYQSLQPRD